MIKTRLDELAAFGGRPAFDPPLYVGRPNVGDVDEVMARIRGVLEDGRLTNRGPQVQELERRIAALVGVKHCIAMCNATVALEIVIRALGMTGEVIVPSMTFVATAHALQWQQVTPVFCDIDPATHNIDPAAVEALITPRTTGIIGVHLWGRPCDTDALQDIARRRGLKLIYDAAHAFGCSRGGSMVGGFGDAEVFSFHATKVLNTFEGGAVMTNDDDLAERVRLMQNFGFAGFDNVIHVGTNGKMSEVSAAMGLASLDRFPDFIARNRDNAHHYAHRLAALPGLSLLPWDEDEECNYHYVVVEVDETAGGLSRDALVKLLHAENVIARRYFFPGAHRMEPYRSYFPHAGLLLPRTEALLGRVLVLPTGAGVGRRHIDAIAAILGLALDHPERINELAAGAAAVRPAADTPLRAAGRLTIA